MPETEPMKRLVVLIPDSLHHRARVLEGEELAGFLGLDELFEGRHFDREEPL